MKTIYSDLAKNASYDVITNKNGVRFAEQAQGYLVNVNLFGCGLTEQNPGENSLFAG